MYQKKSTHRYTLSESIEYQKGLVMARVESGDTYALRNFFRYAVAIQRDIRNYSPLFLSKKMDVSCGVLSELGGCIGACETCPLMLAHQDALEDIRCGIREMPSYVKARHVARGEE